MGELQEKQKQELKTQEELECLKNALRKEKEDLREVMFDRDRIRSLCEEKDTALQASKFNLLTWVFIYIFRVLYLLFHLNIVGCSIREEDDGS